jgi:hypothetical protein
VPRRATAVLPTHAPPCAQGSAMMDEVNNRLLLIAAIVILIVLAIVYVPK